jgi:outer membrane biosynthesis protein TonB
VHNEQARIPAALVASVALHLLFGLVERALPGSAHKPAPTYGMDFEVISEARPAPTPPAPVAQAVVVPPPATATQPMKASLAEPPRRPPEAVEEPLPTVPSPEEPPPSETASPTPAASPSPAAGPSPPASPSPAASPSPPAQLAAAPNAPGAGRTLDLSARAAAHTLVAESEASSSWGASTWGLGEREEREARAAELRDYQSEARLAEALPALSRSGHDPSIIVHAIQDLSSYSAKPWDLILQPLRGARYHYRGTGFDAIIRADGSVQYRTRGGPQLMGGSGKEIDGQPVPTYGVGFHDAPLDKMMGRDANAGERRRFLEQTHALRELLYERGMRAALARADVHLKQRLALIELRLSGGNAERARAELFTLWDECAEDEVGAKARARIESFVREHFEPDSGDTFSSTELVTLNHKRNSHRPFAPYTLSSDAGLAPAALDAAPP